jgi:hypothetical protein
MQIQDVTSLEHIHAHTQIIVTFKKDKYPLQVRDTDCILDIKTKLEPLCGLPKENQKLTYKSLLADLTTVGAAGLKVWYREYFFFVI